MKEVRWTLASTEGSLESGSRPKTQTSKSQRLGVKCRARGPPPAPQIKFKKSLCSRQNCGGCLPSMRKSLGSFAAPQPIKPKFRGEKKTGKMIKGVSWNRMRLGESGWGGPLSSSQHFQAPSAVAAEDTKLGHPLFSFPNSEAPWLCKCLILTQNHEGPLASRHRGASAVTAWGLGKLGPQKPASAVYE